MRSFRGAAAVVPVALVCLVNSLEGQIYPSTMAHAPPGHAAPGYVAPQYRHYGQGNWTYAQPASNRYPLPQGLTRLVGEAPGNFSVPESLPPSRPQMQAVPSPSNAPYYGSPALRPSSPSAPNPVPSAPYPPPVTVPPQGGATNGYGAAPYGEYGAFKGVAPYPERGPVAGYPSGRFGACCATCGRQVCCCANPWFAGAYGLIMARDDDRHYFFSWDTSDERIQLTNTRDANFDVQGGLEICFGRYFNCGHNAVQVVYWGVLPSSGNGLLPHGGESIVTADDVMAELNGILNWSSLDYNGTNAGVFVNNAQAHAVFRENEFHNLEVNLLQRTACAPQNPCGYSRLQYHWRAGVRYFKFRDEMAFAADIMDRRFTWAPAEIYYRVETDNNLVGFQLGSLAEHALTQRLGVHCGLKFGVFGNHIAHSSWIGGAAGTAVVNNGPNQGMAFDVHTSKNDVAFLGELSAGLRYAITSRWAATAGYRAMAATGIAFPSDQIYPNLRAIQDVQVVDSNGSLILHGAYAGVEYSF